MSELPLLSLSIPGGVAQARPAAIQHSVHRQADSTRHGGELGTPQHLGGLQGQQRALPGGKGPGQGFEGSPDLSTC